MGHLQFILINCNVAHAYPCLSETMLLSSSREVVDFSYSPIYRGFMIVPDLGQWTGLTTFIDGMQFAIEVQIHCQIKTWALKNFCNIFPSFVKFHIIQFIVKLWKCHVHRAQQRMLHVVCINLIGSFVMRAANILRGWLLCTEMTRKLFTKGQIYNKRMPKLSCRQEKISR